MMASFWSESFWCPPGVKWTEMSAQFNDLYYALGTALGLLVVRSFCEMLIFRPLGRYLQAPSRRAQRFKERTAKKFGESMWRFVFYSATSIYGWFFVLWDKSYLTDTMDAFRGYPGHSVQPEEWWYYNVELAFYISLVVTQFIETRRKDFWQMFMHHIVTIALLVLSWACNFHRVGAIVMALHDVADVAMEGAKMAKYCSKQRLADLLFAVFTLAWIYTRCYLLPTKVIYYTSYKALYLIPFFPAYYIFNGLLVALQALHLVWTYIILRMVHDALTNDGMRDLRSDSEDSDHEHKD